ncbi:MAG: hypothetical protein ABW321_22565, partial [Polyangiales bacterium]
MHIAPRQQRRMCIDELRELVARVGMNRLPRGLDQRRVYTRRGHTSLGENVHSVAKTRGSARGDIT